MSSRLGSDRFFRKDASFMLTYIAFSFQSSSLPGHCRSQRLQLGPVVLCKGCTGMEHDEGLPLENHLKHTQTKLRRHCLIQPSVCFQCCMCITVARKRQRCRSPTTLTVSAQGIIVNTYLLSVDKLPCKRWLGVHTEVIFFHLVLKLGSTLGQIFTNPRFTNARSQ